MRKTEKRIVLLVVSAVLVLVCLYYSIREIDDLCYRKAEEARGEEEIPIPDFLPPDTVIIEVGRYERPQKKDYDVILGVIVKMALSGGFLGWCIYKYREEKRLTEFMRRRERKNEQQQINIMLDKEKWWKEYEDKQS